MLQPTTHRAKSGFADLSRLSLLLVDDHRHMRGMFRALLMALGIPDVRLAAGSGEALDLLGGRPADIAITDWVMPPAGGLVFLRAVRDLEHSPNPYLPVIVMTADSTRVTVQAASDAGVHEVLAKPISAKAVAERIWSVVTRPRKFVRSDTYFGPDRRERPATSSHPMRRAPDADAVDLEAS